MGNGWASIGRTFLACLACVPMVACAPVHAPLLPDDSYPAAWPPLRADGAGVGCAALAGTYADEGAAVAGGRGRPVSLLSTFGAHPSPPAARVVVDVRALRLGRDGTEVVSVRVFAPNGPGGLVQKECYCTADLLLCPAMEMHAWSLPLAGGAVPLGGTQLNVYLSLGVDGALVGKLQHITVRGIAESASDEWIRFARSSPAESR